MLSPSIYLSIYPIQWCSGKFSLVGTLAWHYGHIPYRYQSGGGGSGEFEGMLLRENFKEIVELGAF